MIADADAEPRLKGASRLSLPTESYLKMELGQRVRTHCLDTVDISAHGRAHRPGARAFFRVVSSLGIGLKAFAYAGRCVLLQTPCVGRPCKYRCEYLAVCKGFTLCTTKP